MTNRCHKCDSLIHGEAVESPVAKHPEGTVYCTDCVATPRVALVGCGAAKIDTDEPVEAQDLYSSNYFGLKRECAETTCDAWYIVSAEHNVLSPTDEIAPYEASLNPSSDSYIGDYEAGVWSERTSNQIDMRLSFWNPTTTVVLLLGQNYERHIQDRVFRQVRDVERPFADTAGIGEQQQWLREQIDEYHPAGQSDLGHWEGQA